MSQVYQLLEKRYPDIAGSAHNALNQKQKPIAMHSLALDDDILSGKPDHTKSAKFIADLLQICQAWLPLLLRSTLIRIIMPSVMELRVKSYAIRSERRLLLILYLSRHCAAPGIEIRFSQEV